MYKPTVPYTPHIYKNYQNRFGGYNHTSSCGEGEIYDMKNIGHEEFPVLTPRRGRNTAPAFDNGRVFPAYSETEIVRPKILDIYSFDDAYVVEEWSFYSDNTGKVESVNGGQMLLWIKNEVNEFEMEPKGNNYTLAHVFGELTAANINKYIATKEGFIVRNDVIALYLSENKLQEAFAAGTKFNVGDVVGVLDNSLVDEDVIQDLTVVQYIYCVATETYVKQLPRTSGDAQLELKHSSVTFGDGTYKGETAEANTISSAKIFAKDLVVGDAITITGCTTQLNNNKTVVIKEISEDRKQLRFYENTFTLNNGSAVTEKEITITRKMPELDYMCQCNNRLFGCKGDTIYASKLGDPYNWNVFEGISTDSYSVEVGSSGDFTGCYAYEGDVLFFKEERIYKLLYTDSSPENWALVEIETYGVKAGCDRSLAVADSRLFWYSPKGMMQYGGSLPVSIAEPFGEQEYINAVAGSDGKDYYVCLTDKAGVPALFVFDTTHNIWFKHDNINVKSFVYHKGDLTALIKKDNGDTEVIRIGQKQPETPIDGEWNDMDSMIEFGDTLYETADKKNKMNLFAVAEVEEGGELKFYLSTDGDEYQLVGEIKGKCKKQIHRFSNVPVRCDYYRIKVEGKGMWKIHAISNGYVPGSDI